MPYRIPVSLLEVWGWVAAATGVVMNVPQLMRLVKERTSAGVALLQWQVVVACSLGWLYHGVTTGHANIVAANVIAFVQATAMTILIMRDRALPSLKVWLLIIAVVIPLFAIEQFAPAGVFGAVVVVPLALGLLAQSRDLVRSRDISGVSPVFLTMAVVLQFLWWSWSFPAQDISITICSSILGAITIFNVTWLTLRRKGLVAVRSAQAA